LRHDREASIPLLSVIVPVHNQGFVLRECLDTLFRSSFRDLEIIVVDDGSTDNSSEITRSDGVQIVRMPDRAGPSAARNAGAGLSCRPDSPAGPVSSKAR
jgi:glycosyltransferase involved in cell wall biosynthesis